MSAIEENEGVIHPSIDELLQVSDNKYALVIYSAKRARQINAYYSQLADGLLEHVGPLVDNEINEKPLSIALREIQEGKLVAETKEGARTGLDGTEIQQDAAFVPESVFSDEPTHDDPGPETPEQELASEEVDAAEQAASEEN
ncbi:MAG: DNA-directed RNA polymerase subunit omega [Micrococcaceae bacterium]